jgi:hypothetical protein
MKTEDDDGYGDNRSMKNDCGKMSGSANRLPRGPRRNYRGQNPKKEIKHRGRQSENNTRASSQFSKHMVITAAGLAQEGA